MEEKEQREERWERAETDICEHFQAKERKYINQRAIADCETKKEIPQTLQNISYIAA